MEIIIFLGLIIFGPMLLGWILRAMKAGATVAVTGKTFEEAMGQIPPMNVRLKEKTLNNEPDGLPFTAIEVKGLFPLQSSKEVAFVISIFDKTDGNSDQKPVICVLDAAQELETPVFQQRADIGRVQPNQGFSSWIEIGRIAPSFLQAPYSGERVLDIVVRLLDKSNEPEISMGFASSNDGVIWANRTTLKHQQTLKGYSEETEHRNESQALAVKLAISVAMADGSFDDTEGVVIKSWVTKKISPFGGGRQETLKSLLNQAMKDAFAQSEKGTLSISPTVARLNEIADDNQKFEAMELCFDVMAADGTADVEEMKLLRHLGESLKLDMVEIEKIRDLRMMDISASIENSASADDVLGIDPSWDHGVIKKHLRREFQKWNARINNLPIGDERNHAQKMLNMIGEARRKYG